MSVARSSSRLFAANVANAGIGVVAVPSLRTRVRTYRRMLGE
jgi:hypothetical protein